MNDKKDKKKFPGMPAPPPPMSGMKKKNMPGAVPPPPFPGKRPAAEEPAAPSASTADNNSNINRLESQLSREREELLKRLRDREDQNLRMQEQFLNREKEETMNRQQELERLKKKLEDEYSRRSQELALERDKWKETLDDIRTETKGKMAVEKMQSQIRQQAFEEAQKEVSQQIEEMRKELDNARRIAYEERIKSKEEEKNSVRVEQALKEVIEGVSRTQKVQDIEKEKEELARDLQVLQQDIVKEKLQYTNKLQESESLRDNLRLDYQNRLKENSLKFENSVFELQSANRQLSSQIYEFQHKYDTKKELWEERLHDKISENEKLITEFRARTGEMKYEYESKLSQALLKKEEAQKDYHKLAKAFEEKSVEMTSRINSLEKEKDFLDREHRARISLLNEKMREKESDFTLKRQLLEEEVLSLRTGLQDKESRWKEKISDLMIQHKSEMRKLEEDLSSRLSEYRIELDRLKDEKDEKDSDFSRLKKKYELNESFIQSLKEQKEQEFTYHKEKFDQEKKRIEEDYGRLVDDLKEKFAAQQQKMRTLSEEILKIEQESRKREDVLNDRIQESELKSRELESISRARQVDIECLHDTINKLEEKNSEIQKDAAVSANSKEEIIYALKADITALKSEKSRQLTELSDKYTAELQVLREQIVLMKKNLDDVNNHKDERIGSLMQDFDLYKENFRQAKLEWEGRKENIESEFRRRESGYRTKISGLEAALEENSLRLKDEQLNYERKIQEITENSRRRMDEHSREVETARRELKDETERLENKLHTAQSEISGLTENIRNQKAAYESLVEESGSIIEALKKENQQIADKLQAMFYEAGVWKQKYEEKAEENARLNAVFEESRQDLEERVSKLKNKY